jgi:hypothetical protein
LFGVDCLPHHLDAGLLSFISPSVAALTLMTAQNNDWTWTFTPTAK